MATVPGPGNYEGNNSKLVGKNLISKFKSAVLAGPMMSKSKRFMDSQSIWLIMQQKLPQFGNIKRKKKSTKWAKGSAASSGIRQGQHSQTRLPEAPSHPDPETIGSLPNSLITKKWHPIYDFKE